MDIHTHVINDTVFSTRHAHSFAHRLQFVKKWPHPTLLRKTTAHLKPMRKTSVQNCHTSVQKILQLYQFHFFCKENVQMLFALREYNLPSLIKLGYETYGQNVLDSLQYCLKFIELYIFFFYVRCAKMLRILQNSTKLYILLARKVCFYVH